MNLSKGRILIVDDEENIRSGLRDILMQDGHEVRQAGDGETALELMKTLQFDLAILDIRMPGMSGDELMQVIRQRWPGVQVILLTGHGALRTAMTAVRAGAHDYLLKPAHPEDLRRVVTGALEVVHGQRERRELLKTLKGSLERIQALSEDPAAGKEHFEPESEQVISLGEVSIDLKAHEVRVGDDPLHLSPTEFDLLVVLARRKGEALDYRTLARLVLGYEVDRQDAAALIKRHVFSLRHKLEPDPSSPSFLLNVRGIGYRLNLP